MYLALLGLSWIVQDLSFHHIESLVVACRLSCSTAYRILTPQKRIGPMSPALQGGFLATGPPGKFVLVSLL